MSDKLRNWCKKLGTVALVGAIDPTGIALGLTAAQQVWNLFVESLPNQNDKTNMAEFIANLSNYFAQQINSNKLSEREAERLLQITSFMVNTITAYDLAHLIADNSNHGFILDRVIKRGGHLLTPLKAGHRGLCEQFISRYLSQYRKHAASFSGATDFFRQAVAEDMASLTQKHEQLEIWIKAIVSGRARNLLLDGGARIPETMTPTVLLTADWQALPFHGREEVLDALLDWANTPSSLAVKTIVGEGGMGKTRLMLEFAQRIKMSDTPWRAGFLRKDVSVDEIKMGLPQPSGKTECLLIILDYAENAGEIIRQLLLSATEARENYSKIRILLLARNEGEWLDNLQDSLNRALADVGPMSVHKLAPLEKSLAGRQAFASEMVIAIRGALPIEKPPVDLPDLDEEHFGRVLFLLLAAYAAAEGRTIADQTELLDFILTRETGIWKNHDKIKEQKYPDHDLRLICALFALWGHTPFDQAISILAGINFVGAAPAPHHLCRTFQYFYPYRAELSASELQIDCIKPDLLAEHLILKAVEKRPALLKQALGPAVEPEQILHAFTVLARISLSNPVHLERIRQLIEEDPEQLFLPAFVVWPISSRRYVTMLEQTFQATASLQLADRISSLLPKRTTSLRQIAVLVEKHRYDAHKNQEDNDRAKFAAAANNLAIRLSAVGQRQEALELAQEAMTLYRKLAEASPEVFLPDLATSLNNLAAMLSAVGQRQEALEPAQEAVTIRRKLAEASPEAFLPGLAGSLNNLANRLSAVGQRQEALEPAQEAMTIRRKLAEASPEAFLPDLAMSLAPIIHQAPLMSNWHG